ncbi:MAG TPA: FISUMP domain-containing protein [Saprospiraceae bacterium]|nr:FISUMP domain-containing protein [Saprospiraceae bacterium]
MKNPFLLLICVIGFFLTTCTNEYVDPNDYRDPELPKDNTLELRTGTKSMNFDNQQEVKSVTSDKVIYDANSSFANSVKVNDIIVNPLGAEKSFIRKVTSISNAGGQIEFTTETAQMTQAFSSWVIDSRTDKLTIVSRSPWEETIGFEGDFGGVDWSFNGSLDPQISLTGRYSNFGLEYRWDENDPQYATGPYIRLYLSNFYLKLEGQVTANISGNAGFSAEVDPIAIAQIPYANFLTLYFSPNLSANASFEGSFTSPIVGSEIGPFNTSCGYDNTTSSLFWRDLPNPAISPLFTLPTVDNLSGSFKPTVGIEFIVAPTGLYESGASDAIELKLAMNAYMYTDFVFLHRGTFDDRQPRISFDAKQGVGFNVGIDFNLFDGFLSTGYSSDDYEYQSNQWNITNLNTCDAFPDASITYSGGLVDISITSGGNHGLGYQVYANDELVSDQVYGYDQTNTIDLPSSSQLVNKIAIVDVGNYGCYLEDIYVDPSLVGNCSDKFIDGRDGNEYCMTDIGGVTWMAENLRYTNGGAIGKWYNNANTDENLIFGRLYTFDEAQDNICPNGWHLPSNGEWNILISELGGLNLFGKNAKAASSILWPSSNLPDETTFGAVPAGEYYSWLEGSTQYNAFGNKGKYARFWSATLLDGSPTMIEIGTGDKAVRNTGESANLIGLSQFKSIRDIGFSCRCVKD